MNLGSLIPPVGWITAIACAAITALWTQSNTAITVKSAADLPELGPVGQSNKTGLVLPSSLDEELARELLETRPLLSEGRRPFVPVPATVEPTVEPEPAPEQEPNPEVLAEDPVIVLRGMIERGGMRRVLIQDLLIGEQAWFDVGDTVQGWTISEIQPESMTLQLQGAEITFNMFEEPIP